MAAITIMRTDRAMPERLDAVSDFLFKAFDGFNRDDRRGWRNYWRRMQGMEPGELARIDVVMPRSGPYHRRHMKIEQSVFDAQERFDHFEQFRYWLKVGAGWVTWAAGPKGGVVPIPKSVSYAAADQEEFVQYHEAVVEFLRGPHAAKYLWSHLGDARAAEMMETILRGFE